MVRTLIAAALTFCATQALASDPQDFNLRTAQDLVNLCALPDGDPMAEAGRSFCYGFLSGAYQYHRAIHPEGKGGDGRICIPDPRPSRAQAAAQYVTWAKANGSNLQGQPVDSLFRFAQATWPCAQPPAKAKAKAK